MIADITRAIRGYPLAFQRNSLDCGGGSRYCGFQNSLRPGFEYFLSGGNETIEGERYKKDPETVKGFLDNCPFAPAPFNWLIVKPADMVLEEEVPEALIFYADPDTLGGLFTLANYDRKDLFGVKTPFGSGCSNVFLYPSIENRRTHPDCILGMFDSSARPYVPQGVLTFTVPFRRLADINGFMDESFLVTGTWDVMKRRIKKRNSKP